MKNFTLLIIFSIIFNFSASAHSNKAINKVKENTNKIAHKKPKLNLKVEKQKKNPKTSL